MSAADTTCDAFLGGRISALQPARGPHRSGHDAVLLAAALPQDFHGAVIDLGAGTGVAGFAVAARCAATRVGLVERDETAAGLAVAALAVEANAAFAARVRVIVADIAAPAPQRAAAGLLPDSADAVIMNPPFYSAGEVRASPNAARADAHVLGEGGLSPWLRTAAALVRPGGVLALIFPAAGLAEVLALLSGRFGGALVMPVQPRADSPAIRVIVRAIAGSRAPLTLLPPLVLHEGTGSAPSAAAEAILRHGAALPGFPPVVLPRRSRRAEQAPEAQEREPDGLARCPAGGGA